MEETIRPLPPEPAQTCFTGDGKTIEPNPIIVITRGPASGHPGEHVLTCKDHDDFFAKLIENMEG